MNAIKICLVTGVTLLLLAAAFLCGRCSQYGKYIDHDRGFESVTNHLEKARNLQSEAKIESRNLTVELDGSRSLTRKISRNITNAYQETIDSGRELTLLTNLLERISEKNREGKTNP